MRLILAWILIIASILPVGCKLFVSPGSHFPTVENAHISQGFGDHVGIDFDIKVGTDVYAVTDSVVIATVMDSQVYGRYLMLLHSDGYVSLYAHLSRILVEFGETVKTGQLIALSGGDPYDNIDGDGQSTGWHLHFEVRPPKHIETNDYNIDPLEYLSVLERNAEQTYIICKVDN